LLAAAGEAHDGPRDAGGNCRSPWGHRITTTPRSGCRSDDDVRTALKRTQAALTRVAEGPAPAGPGHNSGHNGVVVVDSRGL